MKPVDGLRRVDAGRLEVERQCARRHTEADATRVARVEPGDLLGDERGRTKREQQRDAAAQPFWFSSRTKVAIWRGWAR